MPSIKPLGDRVVIRRLVEAETLTPAGLVIPDNARQTSQEAEVLAVGAKVESGLQVGDRVLIGKYVGTELTVDRQTLIILREDEILAVIEVGQAAKKR